VYQPVFSCQTCYEEQANIELTDQQKDQLFKSEKSQFKEAIQSPEDGIVAPSNKESIGEEDERVEVDNLKLSKLIKPHGFCLGCMLHCHDGHEVHELYSKLDFRCDCGNSRMPFACQFEQNSKSD